jgi:hypothetical protein
MSRFAWAIVGVAVAAVPAQAGLADTLAEGARENLALLRARALETACEAYYANPQSANTYPRTLDDLAAPPFGGASFLRNGRKDLLDPWGQTYKYAVVADPKGRPLPYVWTERTVRGTTRVIGTKPKA